MKKLNVGCGSVFEEGYINIDAKDVKGLDLRCDALAIKDHFKDGTIDEIRCSHMLEHLDKKDQRKLLKIFRDLLVPNGSLYVAVPDLTRIIALWQDPESPLFDDFTLQNCLYGIQRDPYDLHRYCHTEHTIKELLKEFNFTVDKVKPGRPGFPHSPSIEIWATKD